jgi:hypothetical protein
MMFFFIFFAGQRKRSKRKAARNFDPDKPGLPSLMYLSSEGPKTRFAQTVWTLLPQSNTTLGCVAWDLKKQRRTLSGHINIQVFIFRRLLCFS